MVHRPVMKVYLDRLAEGVGGSQHCLVSVLLLLGVPGVGVMNAIGRCLVSRRAPAP